MSYANNQAIYLYIPQRNSKSKFSKSTYALVFYRRAFGMDGTSLFLQNSMEITENSLEDNIRVVVGLDFGTTYSGFAYCHVSGYQNVCSNDCWNGEVGQLKTNTVLQYDDKYNVTLWGAPAMAQKPSRRNRRQNNEGNKPVELFKLYLGDISDKFKPKLPVEYKKAITDYLREIGKV
jgi:hypothetical protein